MEKKNILLLEDDKPYAAALSNYLKRTEGGWSVSVKTDPEGFDPGRLNLREDFDLCLMSERFVERVRDREVEDLSGNVVALLGSHDKGYDLPSIYKFQSMDSFREKLKGYMYSGTKRAKDSDCSFIAVYPPVQTHLSLPFSVLLALLYAKREKTVLLDMEENSYLSFLIRNPFEMSLTDYLYLLESEDEKDGGRGSSLEKCLISFEDLYILPPVKNPSEISYISEAEWGRILEDIRFAGFKKAVLLFDRMHRGFFDMVSQCESILLPGDQELYYKASRDGIMNFLESYDLAKISEEVYIPKDICEIPNSEYPMEELMQGRLNSLVRSRFLKQENG